MKFYNIVKNQINLTTFNKLKYKPKVKPKAPINKTT